MSNPTDQTRRAPNSKMSKANRKDNRSRAEKTYEAYVKNLDVADAKIARNKKIPFERTKEGVAKHVGDIYDASKRETAARMAKGGPVKKKKSSGAAIRGKGCEIK